MNNNDYKYHTTRMILKGNPWRVCATSTLTDVRNDLASTKQYYCSVDEYTRVWELIDDIDDELSKRAS